MLRHRKQDILSKNGNKVNVKFYPGATAENITDHLRPAMRKKADVTIIHAGTNDLTNDVNTMKSVKTITNIIEEMKGVGDIQVGFSGIIERRDHGHDEKIKDINERIQRFCNNKGFFFFYIYNSNVDENSLNNSLSHFSSFLNRLFSENLINALKGF